MKNGPAIDPRLPRGIPDDGRGTVVTVGTFDGVHRGHWAVLEEIRGDIQEDSFEVQPSQKHDQDW